MHMWCKMNELNLTNYKVSMGVLGSNQISKYIDYLQHSLIYTQKLFTSVNVSVYKNDIHMGKC